MNKQLVKYIALFGICSFALVGCSNNQSTKTLTDEEKGVIRTEILEFGLDEENENVNVKDLDKLIEKNIAYFNQEEKDEIIDTYTVNLFNFVNDLSTKLYTIGYELEDVVEKYEIDVLDSSTYKKIPNEHAMVRGFLEEVKEEGFVLESEDTNKNYYISVNIQGVLDKYGKHLSDSLRTYLEFNAYEMNEKGFYNEDKGSIDIDEVVDRIKTLQTGIAVDKKQDYAFIDKWTSSLEYYYNVLFGTSHEYFISSEYIKDDILEKYKEIAQANKENQLGKDMQSVLDILNKNGNRFDANTSQEILEVIAGIYTDEIQKAIYKKYPEQIMEDSVTVEEDN